MSKDKVSEAQIAVHWKEEALIRPNPAFIAQANMTDPAIFERFGLDNFPDCYKEYADLLDWDRYWHTMFDPSDAPCWKWFVGGLLNASYNCIDRTCRNTRTRQRSISFPNRKTRRRRPSLTRSSTSA